MRWAVVGSGAMGSLFASHLAAAGIEVWACDRWAEHVAAMAASGLRVRKAGVESVVPIRATTAPDEPGAVDVVIVFVKHTQTREALRWAAPLVGPATCLLTLQNGLGNVELLREAFPGNRIVFGFTTLTSELLAPGHIEASYTGLGETYLWPVDGKPDARIAAIRDTLERAGLHSIVTGGIEQMIWQKLVVNCCLNTVCAITGLPVGELCGRPEAWTLLDNLAGEIVEVAAAKGIALDLPQAKRFLQAVAQEASDHVPSMLVDVRNRRATEIESLTGAVLREAGRLGVRAPFNQAVYSLVRLIESSYGS